MNEPCTSPSTAFWAFSLRLYGSAEVAESCLALQDRQGVDVNLLLFMLWAGRCGRRLSLEEVRMLVAFTEDWRRTVVAPLRGVRRALRTPPAAIDAAAAAALRNEIKTSELESERLQQAALAAFRPMDALGASEAPERAAAANLTTYAAVLSAVFDPAPIAAIRAALGRLPP